ncbi:hypothetical protein ACKVWC_009403 [Pyricularia oryzae]|nr:hypothetical protein MCOR26_002952 [Pyricularia oryzae]KAI6339726.1 hypothetical protein MCOR30_002720 [Pyricularia oryzae]KAI6341646.1 hypothetical protein MCOR28_005924 [Pyricularia oryzae]KAI6430431.1 hypothetical protein MCOR21_004539 [Pyricularia oryzae]KAI6588917.1 hypothetical protein MCOR12_008973 [Pyricularia oryzae]
MATSDDQTVPIPEPQGLPLLGNIGAIDNEFPLGSLLSMASKYGEIWRMRFPGRSLVFVSTQALVNEVCDEKRFYKSINPTLKEVRGGTHDGLFTAYPDEENWGIAHRILMPAFGPLSIRSMYDEMHDIASQLALKWARYGSNSPIMVTDDFTRLTLDTLALCSMGFRFNSYYSTEMHPFIDAMADFLVECGTRGRRPPLPSIFYRTQDQKFDSDIEILRKTAREVLEARKAGEGADRRDLLHAMLSGVDSKTGKKMTDESIMDNLITFLIAGHETTSGLLSFVFYELMKHPEFYEKAQREVDEVCGKGPITVEHMSKLPYLNAVLRETLRVHATIPNITVAAREDDVLGGKYKVSKDEVIVLLLAKSQVDPRVWGKDADEFVPERMLDENFERITKEFPNSWKPFGNGMRACIGRPFAWQEALLVMAVLLQNFNFVLAPNYQYALKQTLTLKPKDLYMRAILRDGLNPTTLERRLQGLSQGDSASTKQASGAGAGAAPADATGVPLTVLYGSNSGTCEALARRIATDAPSHGFYAATVDCMDSAKGKLPTDQAVVIITASYEGQPPDNAGHFVAWLEGSDKAAKPCKDVSYAVFGCGHKDWAQTFHRVPRLVDDSLQELGASRLVEPGLSDVSTGAVFSDFESWEDDKLWPALAARYQVNSEAAAAENGAEASVKVHVSNPRINTLRQDVKEARVIEAKVLTSGPESTSEGGRQFKRHLEIELPEGMEYSAGDYLAVLPVNPIDTVLRTLHRFGLARDAHVTIEMASSQSTALPTNTSVPAFELLSSYVELSQPATKRNLSALQDAASDEETKSQLGKLSGDDFADEVGAKRVSVLDLLERFPAIDLPIGSFLSMMPPMRVRQYSISSSPLVNPSRVTLSFSVLDAPSLSGQGRHIGVASNYLSSLNAGDSLHVSVRPSHAAFSLPSDQERTPLICAAAGTGLAPFRGFAQERAAMVSAGRKLAPALLYFGCRDPDFDDLYRDEFDEWEKLGAVEVRRTYSRKPEASDGCKHVQDRIVADADRLLGLWMEGAKLYVCGSRGVSHSVMDAMTRIKMDKDRELHGKETTVEEARQYFDDLRNVRYATDVFD